MLGSSEWLHNLQLLKKGSVSLDKSVKGIREMLQFADDVAIYTTETSPEEALPKFENTARELSRYLNDSGL
jgi:hypothetical protein